jgi:hypothetical protein
MSKISCWWARRVTDSASKGWRCRPKWARIIDDGEGRGGSGGFSVQRLAVVGDRIQGFGFAHAFAFVIDDDALGGAPALEADLDGAVGQMARSLEAQGFESESVVGADLPVLLDEEELVVGLVGRQIAHAAAVQREPIQRRHFQDGMLLRVVVLLDPVDELAVERLQGTQVQRPTEELLAHGAKEALDFSLGGAIAHRRVMEQAADAGADLHDLFGGIDGAVVHI